LRWSKSSLIVIRFHVFKLIRHELFEYKFKFNGTLHSEKNKTAVPQILLTLVNMLLEGPGNFDANENKAAMSIAQLIVFNAVKKPRKSASVDVHYKTPIIRHPISQEMPLPVYLGMLLHASTRKKKLVDKCFDLGLSISYSRVMQISNKVVDTVCTEYH